MKNTITLLCVLAYCTASAQFSFQPQIGLEKSRTSIKSNDFRCFAPLGSELSARLGIRLNYLTRSGHGGFVGLSTQSQAVNLKFTDPQNVKANYTASGKETQLGLEAGYQFRSKPISLGTCPSTNRAQKSNNDEKSNCISKASRCQPRTASHCSKSYKKSIENNKESRANNGVYMRVIPSAGLAYRPAGSDMELITENGLAAYEYKAGWKTAVITGAAFEFGRLNQPHFTVSMNYLKSVCNSEETINSVNNGKSVATTFRTRTSAFNVSLGIPLNFKKNKSSSYTSSTSQLQRNNASLLYIKRSVVRYMANNLHLKL